MTMPTNQCPWRMQVHHITQETPDVWTISLICHDYYPYRAGAICTGQRAKLSGNAACLHHFLHARRE